MNAEQRERRTANPDKTRAQNRKSYWANREKNLAAMRDWEQRNKEQRRAYSRVYRVKWRRENIEAHRAQHRVYMARRNRQVAGAPIPKHLIEARLAFFGPACWMCGGTFEHLDHVKPLSKGGPHMLSNIRPACGDCNRRKGGRWFGVQRLSVFIRGGDDAGAS